MNSKHLDNLIGTIFAVVLIVLVLVSIFGDLAAIYTASCIATLCLVLIFLEEILDDKLVK